MNFSYQKTAKKPRGRVQAPTTLPKELIIKIGEYLPRQAAIRGKGFVRMVHGSPRYYPVVDWRNLPERLKQLYISYNPKKEFILVSDRRLTNDSLFVVVPFSGSNSLHLSYSKQLRTRTNNPKSA